MPNYDFRSLSPIDFEVFVRDLLNAELRASFVSFAVGPDGGVDLRDTSNDQVQVAQCKHRPDAKKGAIIAGAIAEAKRWSSKPLDKYYYVISAPVSPDVEKEIQTALEPLPTHFNSVWHQGSLNAALARNPQVEKNHIKLWLSSTAALEKIVEAAQWQRSEELLQKVADRVKLYVYTPAYAQAMSMLEKEQTVIISGAPGVGKSTLAEMILLSLWHEGWTVVNIASNVDDAWTKFRSSEEKVVFYYDDFLGQTSVAELQKNEASGILLLMDRVRASKGNKLLILTSREQILGQVRAGADDRARRIAEDRTKFRIELGRIDRLTKAEMLFNHLHFGFPDKESRGLLATDVRYLEIVDHKGFNPRILESIVLRQKHTSIDAFYASIIDALEHPKEIWSGSFHQLPQTAVKILFHLATHPTGFILLEEIRESVKPKDPRDWIFSLKVLEDTWVRLISDSRSSGLGEVNRISLYDPSRRDFLLDLLDDPAYFDSVLDNIASLQQLNYLLRLAGILKGASSSAHNGRTLLARYFEKRADKVDQIFHKLAQTGIKSALSQEQFIHLKYVVNAEPPRPDWFASPQNYEDRISTLTEIASVSSSPILSTPFTVHYLNEQLATLLEMLTIHTHVEAPPLFELAWALAPNGALATFKSQAVQIANIALEIMNEVDGLRVCLEMPDWFKREHMQGWGEDRVNEVFEWELDALCQQDNPELMQRTLDELKMLAEENDYELNVDSLYEKIEHLKSTQVEQKPQITPTRPHVSMKVGTDENIRSLFEKLK